ncbi:MAG TPA: 50S ribosomal protein L19 [bacterium]|nr:50S ribosomal protein L19 [bacterium]
MNTIQQFEKDYLKKGNNIPKLEIGDTVKVHHKIVEGGKERTQVFQGVVISIKGGGLNTTFTVRKVSFSIGVEKTFPLHSPRVEDVTVVKHAKIRRAKLYYLRDLSGKSARLKERIVASKTKTKKRSKKKKAGK